MKKIMCLKPEKLTEYGLIEYKNRYVFKTTKGTTLFIIWKDCKLDRKRQVNRLIRFSGNYTSLSNNALECLCRMYKDEVIDFVVEKGDE